MKEGSKIVYTKTMSDGSASVPPSKTMPVGTHTLTATYSGDGTYDEASDTVTVTVDKATPKLFEATVKGGKQVTKGEKFKTKFTVTADGFVPTGKVVVKYKGDIVGSGMLSNGKLIIEMRADFPVGAITLKAQYKGDKNTKPSNVQYDLAVGKRA